LTEILDQEIDPRDPKDSKKKAGLMGIFLKSQVSAFAASAADFITVVVLTELFGVWYVISTAIGAAVGAIVNFMLGRNWVFDSKDGKIGGQAIRYIIISIGSLILNTVGVYLITEYIGINYAISKIIIGILVGVTYNFILQKKFVFK